MLAVSAVGSTIKETMDLAYEGVTKVAFEGATFRRDIAHRYAYLSSAGLHFFADLKQCAFGQTSPEWRRTHVRFGGRICRCRKRLRRDHQAIR